MAAPAPGLGPLEASPGAATFTERLLAFALPRLLDDPDKVRTRMCKTLMHMVLRGCGVARRVSSSRHMACQTPPAYTHAWACGHGMAWGGGSSPVAVHAQCIMQVAHAR